MLGRFSLKKIILILIAGVVAGCFLFIALVMFFGGVDPQLQNIPNTPSDRFDLSQKKEPFAGLVDSVTHPGGGALGSALTVVEFADFQCAYCKQLHPVIRRLMVEYKDSVRFVFRDYPFLDDFSVVLAMAGRCAHEQGRFFPFFDRVYGSPSTVTADSLLPIAKSIGLEISQFQICLSSERYKKTVLDDLAVGIKAGVTGTPTLFINGNIIPGAPEYSTLKQIFESSLK